ncbi:hypothetical protein V8J88_16815 [Massilia sp. W12]|uniref:hypothetical protein n=1 Tax=Massilia sp. W12 TaxID=3126507 RepID=UPI0030CF4FD5
MDIVERIRQDIPLGVVIPKPEAKSDFKVKAWGKRRGEKALVYWIPNHKNPGQPYAKGVTESEFRQAFAELSGSGVLTREWVNEHLPACAKEGGCNFTTIGGVFVLLGLAKYAKKATYHYTP